MNKFLQQIQKYIVHNKELVIILLIGAFFRFFHFSQLQFWSTDEELIAHFSRKIIEEHKIFLISPIFTISTSLGSGFQIVTSFLYWLAKLQPERVLLLGTMLSFITMILIYNIGNAIQGKRVGIFAALLYAASAHMSLSDRRWWTLTTAPFFTALALYAIINLRRKNPLHAVLLAIAIVSTWQIDPNMAILPVAALFSILLLKIKVTKKQLLCMLAVFFLSIAPLLIFEWRHPGTIIQPILHHMLLRKDLPAYQSNPLVDLMRFPHVYASYLFVWPHSMMDAIFNWIIEAKPISFIVDALVFLTMTMTILIVGKKPKDNQVSQDIHILAIFWFVSVASLIAFTVGFHRIVQPQYVHVSMPIVYLLFAYTFHTLTRNKNLLFIGSLILYVVINTFTLTQMKFEFPLRDKQMLVRSISDHLGDQQFSLHVLQRERLVNTGFTGLFMLNHRNPVKSTDYMALDWWYRTQSLYFTTPSADDPSRVVVIGRKSDVPRLPDNEFYYTQSGNMEAVILDNSEKWFDIRTLPTN